MLVFGLSTPHKLGLALVGLVFVVFALSSALLIPRYRPDFPGLGLKTYVAATIVLFVGMLAAVELFAKESKEEPSSAGAAAATAPATSAPATTQAAPSAGDPVRGKAVFAQAGGCGACHTFSAAGTSAKIGPDLDTQLPADAKKAGQPLVAFTRQSIVDPNAFIAPGFTKGVMPPDFGKTLSKQQIDDLVAFLTQKRAS